MFTGVYTALITPFKDNKIDYDALNAIIEMQIEGGVDGIVPMGTTGESPTVSFEEHKSLIKEVVKMAGNRVKVVAGAGANSTEEAIWLSGEPVLHMIKNMPRFSHIAITTHGNWNH